MKPLREITCFLFACIVLIMDRFGFIITRCVNETSQDLLWKECIACIRKIYSTVKIILIDDHSNVKVDETILDNNVILILSNYKKGCGELLPYIYFYTGRYFQNAIIIHDSVMFMQPLDESIVANHENVYFLWYFTELTSSLSVHFQKKIHTMLDVVGISRETFDMSTCPYLIGCFGTMSVMSLHLLDTLYSKHPLNNLIEYIDCRDDRCVLERVFSIICFHLCHNVQSVYQNIRDPYSVPLPFYMNLEIYNANKAILQQRAKVVKIWCGR